MRVSISNIAWQPAEDEAVAALLARHGVDRIDIAPGKYFADPAAASDAEVARVRGWWADRGVELWGMQSLLYGTTGLNLFGDDGRMLDRLARICGLAARLGIRALTFGSPGNRRVGDRDPDAAVEEAVGFFRALGAAAAAEDVVVCLEPNPARYGCDFMLTTDETAAVVRAVAEPAIRLQLDVGALTVVGDDAEATIAAHADIIGHGHASEPGLGPLGSAGSDHAAAAAALRRHRPDLTVAIEMVAGEGSQLGIVDGALALAGATYGASR